MEATRRTSYANPTRDDHCALRPQRTNVQDDDLGNLFLMRRPIGVTVIAVLFLVLAVYLWVGSTTVLIDARALQLLAGFPLRQMVRLYGVCSAPGWMWICSGGMGFVSATQLGPVDHDVPNGSRFYGRNRGVPGRRSGFPLATAVAWIGDHCASRRRLLPCAVACSNRCLSQEGGRLRRSPIVNS